MTEASSVRGASSCTREVCVPATGPQWRPTPASTQGEGQGPAQEKGQAQGQGHVLAAEPFYFESTEHRNLCIIALRLCLPGCLAFIYVISMVLQLPSMRNQKKEPNSGIRPKVHIPSPFSASYALYGYTLKER